MSKPKTIKAWAVVIKGFLVYQRISNLHLKPKSGEYSAGLIFSNEEEAKDFLKKRKAGGLVGYAKVVPVEINLCPKKKRK